MRKPSWYPGQSAVVFRSNHALADGLRLINICKDVLKFEDGTPAEVIICLAEVISWGNNMRLSCGKPRGYGGNFPFVKLCSIFCSRTRWPWSSACCNARKRAGANDPFYPWPNASCQTYWCHPLYPFQHVYIFTHGRYAYVDITCHIYRCTVDLY